MSYNGIQSPESLDAWITGNYGITAYPEFRPVRAYCVYCGADVMLFEEDDQEVCVACKKEIGGVDGSPS